MIKLGGLWKRTGKNGTFLAGKLGDASIMIFPNNKKTAPNQPDYTIFIAESKPQAQKPTAPKAPVRNEAPSFDDDGPDFL